MISVYRAFVRNDDSLGDRAKKGIFEENSEWSQYIVLLSDIMIVWEIQQKYEFLDKTNVFPGDLKISSFFPRFFWLILEVHTSLCLPILVILTRLTEQAKISTYQQKDDILRSPWKNWFWSKKSFFGSIFHRS